MQTLMEDEPEKYQTHFSEYVKAGVEPDTIEEVYKKVHAAIRADPTSNKSEKHLPKEDPFTLYVAILTHLLISWFVPCLFQICTWIR